MAIQHAVISDADRHEAKGASTALTGQVLQSNGDGTTTFVYPETLKNVSLASALISQSLVNQNISGTDNPLQVNFGAANANTSVSVDSGGTITFLEDGSYLVNVDLHVGRSNNTGTATIYARALVNDQPYGPTYNVEITSDVSTRNIHFMLPNHYISGDTIKIQVIRESTGANDGGLYTRNPTLAGWENTPSAAVVIQKIIGSS